MLGRRTSEHTVEVYIRRAPSAKALISGRLADEATKPRRGGREGGQAAAVPVMSRGPAGRSVVRTIVGGRKTDQCRQMCGVAVCLGTGTQ